MKEVRTHHYFFKNRKFEIVKSTVLNMFCDVIKSRSIPIARFSARDE
jgi:hypothetical protein